MIDSGRKAEPKKWNIWKKRKRRVSNQESKSVEEVAYSIKGYIQQFKMVSQAFSIVC
jgi:hypothetical protein